MLFCLWMEAKRKEGMIMNETINSFILMAGETGLTERMGQSLDICIGRCAACNRWVRVRDTVSPHCSLCPNSGVVVYRLVPVEA